MQELVEAEEQICFCMLQRLEEMNVKAKVMFLRATEWENYCLFDDFDNENGNEVLMFFLHNYFAIFFITQLTLACFDYVIMTWLKKEKEKR